MKVLSIRKDPKLRSALRIFWGNLRKKDRNAPELDLVKFLKRIPFFENLRAHQLELVSQQIHKREYNENEYLFELNQPGAAVFIIQSGEVSVELPQPDGVSMQIATLTKWSFVGELALLDDTPRSASARAVVPTMALALFRDDLERIMKIDSEITAHIYKALANIVGQRLKATNELLEKKSEAA